MPDPFPFGNLQVTASGPPDGRSVLVLHGWGSSAEVMRPVANMMADERRVYTVDLPGHGQAPVPRHGLNMEAHAREVADLIRSKCSEGVDIVGHSNGGRIALWMASEPDLASYIGRLALISPSGVRRPRTAGYYVRRTIAEVLKAPFRIPPEPIKSACLDWLRHSLVWRALGSSDYRSLEGAMRETFVELVNTYLEDRLSSVQSPTLLLWGEDDPAISRSQMDTMLRLIPDCGLYALPGAGHFCFQSQPAIVRAALRQFLGLSL